MDKYISIIGGGMIGQQWAMLFTAHKYNIFIYESVENQVENCKSTIESNLRQFMNQNISRSNEELETQLSRIFITNKYEDLPKNSDFVLECVPEDIDIKRKAFQLIDSYFSDGTIRMSSSSYLPISYFTESLNNKSKCIIAHPVSPPYFLRLVEVSPAPYTDEQTILKTKELMESIGQLPVILKKEVYGFVLNRIQSTVFNSVFKIIQDDIIDVNDVDKIMTEGLGPRWAFYGPLTVAALNGPGIGSYCNKYLNSIDRLNKEQNYEPQHDEILIERIVKEMKHTPNLSNLNSDRNFNLGQVLKIKTNKKDLDS